MNILHWLADHWPWVLVAQFLVFVALMLLWPWFNRKMAGAILGAPPGYSFSGFLWKLEQDGNESGNAWRPVVDAIVFVVSRNNQLDHCRKAYEKDIAAGAKP